MSRADSVCDDEVDPRVQIELERLNTSTDDINKLEVDLDEARAAFRSLLIESTTKIDVLAKKLGACVEKSRPYYDARMRAKEALLETQKAAVRFERANSAHSAAKEMVYLAEEGLQTEGRTFDHAWQEMLNHATMRVNESESERTLSEQEHRKTSLCYHDAETRVQQLQRDLKRSIAKSSRNARRSMLQLNILAYQHQLQLLPYFEMKAHFNQIMEEQKRKVRDLEHQVSHAKLSYAEALRNLEQISDEIHKTRQCQGSGEGDLGLRKPGVGAESPVPLRKTVEKVSLTSSPLSSMSSVSGVWRQNSLPETEEEYYKLPENIGPAGSPPIALQSDAASDKSSCSGDYKRPPSCSSVLSRNSSQCDASRMKQNDSVHSSAFSRTFSLDDGLTMQKREEDKSKVKSRLSEVKESVPQLLKDSSTAEKVKEILVQGMRMLSLGGDDSPDAPIPIEGLVFEETEHLLNTIPMHLELPADKNLLGVKDDDPSSDSESLASVDMLTDEQISGLMLEIELQKACEDVLGTPVSEISPLMSDS